MSGIKSYAWKEVVRRKRRSFWNFFGYALAVIFFAVLLTHARTARTSIETALQYTGAQFVGFLIPDENYTGIQANDAAEGFYIYNYPTELFDEAVIDQIRLSSHVKDAAAFLSYRLRLSPDASSTWLLAGFEPSIAESVRSVSCSNTDIVAGRMLQPGDEYHVMVEQTFAASNNLSVNDIIQVGGRPFEIVGLLSPGTRPAKADLYVPVAKAREILNERLGTDIGTQANVVLVDGASSEANPLAIAEVKNILGANAFTVGYGCFSPASSAVGVARIGTWLVAFFVFVAVVAVLAVMQFFALAERRCDMAVLLAIGWSYRAIQKQVIFESLFQAIIGGFAGVVALVIGPAFIEAIAGVRLFAMFQAVVLALLCSVAAALVASRQIKKMNPAVLLRKL